MNQPPTDAKRFARWLVAHRACGPAREWAAGKDLHTIWTTCERGDWMEWLLDTCWYTWAAPALDVYEHVAALALAEYRRVTAPAWAEYQGAVATACAEYRRVTAPAWAEYERVTAAAHAECERVKAEAIRTVIGYPFRDEGKED